MNFKSKPIYKNEYRDGLFSSIEYNCIICNEIFALENSKNEEKEINNTYKI